MTDDLSKRLDEILGNATDLPITEHATDTHGVTLVNFGLFDLLGMQLSPRIRDLGRITLCRPGPRPRPRPGSRTRGPLLTRRTNLDLIAEHYDDLLHSRRRANSSSANTRVATNANLRHADQPDQRPSQAPTSPTRSRNRRITAYQATFRTSLDFRRLLPGPLVGSAGEISCAAEHLACRRA
ncbi:Tn3 family transposase [Nocardia sp. NPDC051052]|uniref:Tn3 family transposase n=1 Tax=Nocardia sp. NPDC051052 TaxID=3364322 RepID=UPI0037BBF7EC